MTTVGTWLHTLLSGTCVGSDDSGNRYYVERRPAKGAAVRRWVIYAGEPEASKVPPRWHAWLHYLTDKLPQEQDTPEWPWQQPHQPNLTGTDAAYRPKGSQLRAGPRARGTGDYEPWIPS